jgi:hypothetical protein
MVRARARDRACDGGPVSAAGGIGSRRRPIRSRSCCAGATAVTPPIQPASAGPVSRTLSRTTPTSRSGLSIPHARSRPTKTEEGARRAAIAGMPLNAGRGIHPRLCDLEHEVAVAGVVGFIRPTQAVQCKQAHLLRGDDHAPIVHTCTGESEQKCTV